MFPRDADVPSGRHDSVEDRVQNARGPAEASWKATVCYSLSLQSAFGVGIARGRFLPTVAASLGEAQQGVLLMESWRASGVGWRVGADVETAYPQRASTFACCP